MQQMTSKERIQAALNHRMPDRVPMNEFLYSRNLYEEVIGRRPTFYNAEDVFDCAHKLGLDSAVMPIGGFAGIRNADEDADEQQMTEKLEDIMQKCAGSAYFIRADGFMSEGDLDVVLNKIRQWNHIASRLLNT